MKYEYKNSIVNVKCSECNSLIMQCDNCLKVFKPNENIICNEMRHYCENCYTLIIIKNEINLFSLSSSTYILHCDVCDSVIKDCEYCNTPLYSDNIVYCSKNGEHICEKCYNKIKSDKND